MSRKQRTPEEIEAEMQEQEAEPEDERNDEDAEDTEESDEEDESEEEGDLPDKYALLIEDEADLLCLGYSPEQLKKLMPSLLERYMAVRKQKIVELATVANPETVAALMEAFDEHVLPALKEVMRVMRQQLGTNHAKVAKVSIQFTGMILYYGMLTHADIMASPAWPQPENGA